MGEIRKDGVGYPVLFLGMWSAAVASGVAGLYVGSSRPDDKQPPAHSRELARTGVDITCAPSPMGKPTIPMWDVYPGFSEFALQRKAGPGGLAVATCTDGIGQSAAYEIRFFPIEGEQSSSSADFILPGPIENYTTTSPKVSAPTGEGDQVRYVTSETEGGLSATMPHSSNGIIHQQPTLDGGN